MWAYTGASRACLAPRPGMVEHNYFPLHMEHWGHALHPDQAAFQAWSYRCFLIMMYGHCYLPVCTRHDPLLCKLF